MDAQRVFYDNLKFEKFTYEELSFLKNLAQQELSILGLYEKLVEYDCNNPVSDVEDTENIEKAKQYFPYYKEALQGIDEIVDRHIAVFEADYEQVQAEENAKKEAQRKVASEKADAEKKKREIEQKEKEDKDKGIIALFGSEETAPQDDLCEQDNYEDCLTEEELQKDSDFDD